jgi:Sec-independent protein translocase protein TatA
MDFLGIGPLEVLFILVIALIVFGPKDLVKAGQAAGRFLRKLVTSEGWRTISQTSRDLRNLPNKLIREAGLEEMQQDINNVSGFANPTEELKNLTKEIDEEMTDVSAGLSAWTTPSTSEIQSQENPPSEQNTIQPPENN